MRLVPTILSFLVSLNSFCTTLRLESDGYTLEAVLRPTAADFGAGAIDATHAKMGPCKGKFSYDARAQIFVVEFDNINNCPKENIEIDIIRQNLYDLYQGQRIRVKFRSELFYMRDMFGFLRVVAS